MGSALKIGHFDREVKAVALYSGGLDSLLAISVMKEQGIAVSALTFRSFFTYEKFSPAEEELDFPVKICHLGEKFTEVVKNPVFGYGKNMNPCIDCRILMLKEAKVFMELINADFIITGEVLNQRPMSQRMWTFPKIDIAAGLSGYVVRPLTAKNLPPTIPEQKGLVKRELLYDIRGRSRKKQMDLAQKFGIKNYPSPSGGCLLTDPGFSRRLSEHLSHSQELTPADISLLKYGRHFRIKKAKVVVGRNKEENEKLLSLKKPTDALLEAEDYPSPVVLVRGAFDEEVIEKSARLCARYSDAPEEASVRAFTPDGIFLLKAKTLSEDEILSYLISGGRS